ncbi:MAG: ABC transporter ATP-binding protein [Candidatus Latescibacteria bacterium]|nr:ABC transporter ATP-binding protein [Candidatus Latescibacterota bacterium]
MTDSPVLATRALTKVFTTGDRTLCVLNGITLSVQKGEFLTIMGPSGCGKSTLLHLLSGLERPTSGDIMIDGQSIIGLSRRRMTLLRRAKIGFIFQFFNLLPNLTVRENIALPLLIGGERPESRRAHLDALMEWVGITDRMEHFPHQLSGGEMQRVSIARALANTPAIVLADEPTGNVGTHVGEEIMRLLRACADDRGQTILLVTHNAKDAARGDRVLFLNDGVIASNYVLTGPEVNERRIFACLQELGI